MNDREAFELAKNELAALGISPAMSFRGGTWAAPGAIEYEAGGEKTIMEFWPGNKPDELARALFRAVMLAVDPGRLDYLKSKAHQLA